MSLLRSALVLGVLFGGLCTATAKDKEKDKEEKTGKKITDKSKEVKSAITIDFQKELGLGFASLTSMGIRIERARKAPDPVGLAAIATELAVAEKVSGKEAAVTAAVLFKEAIHTAKLRRDSKELKAVALLVKDETVSKDLTNLSKAAQKLEEAIAKGGDKEKGVWWLYVHNNTGYGIYIYENLRYLGYVAPFGNAGPFFVGHGSGTNSVLIGKAPGKQWGPTIIDQTFNRYDWYLD